MSSSLIIQLIVSFLSGGLFIALLSFMAEKSDKRVAGIIITFPTTIALGFFFLGWTLSPETASQVVPATLIPLGLAILFPVIYSYIAEYISKAIENVFIQICLSFILSISIWFLLSVPVIVFQLDSLLIGILGYFFLIGIAYFLLKKKDNKKSVSLHYTLSQKIFRIFFVGFIVFLVVLLGNILNPFWGGMFAMFPAAFSSLIVLIHWYYKPQNLFPMIQKAPIGSLSLFAYALIVMFVFPKIGFVFGTIIAYLVSLIVSIFLAKLHLK